MTQPFYTSKSQVSYCSHVRMKRETVCLANHGCLFCFFLLLLLLLSLLVSLPLMLSSSPSPSSSLSPATSPSSPLAGDIDDIGVVLCHVVWNCAFLYVDACCARRNSSPSQVDLLVFECRQFGIVYILIITIVAIVTTTTTTNKDSGQAAVEAYSGTTAATARATRKQVGASSTATATAVATAAAAALVEKDINKRLKTYVALRVPFRINCSAMMESFFYFLSFVLFPCRDMVGREKRRGGGRRKKMKIREIG